MFVKSLFNVSRVDLGLEVDALVTFAVSPELNGYTPGHSAVLFERLEDELAALPGVTGVTVSMVPLLAGSNWGSSVSVEGFESGPDTDAHSNYNHVGPGYFRTLGIPLIAGREFSRADSLDAPAVAIVNERFAEKFGLGRDAVGKRMGIGFGNAVELDIEIVGLVQDAKYSEVKDDVPPLFFRPWRQDDGIGDVDFYVRTSLAPELQLAAIPGVVARLDRNLPVEDLQTMSQRVRDNVFLDRFISVLSVAFALLATLLAAIGLYGVLAYTVAQRTWEIGLRMAIGAAPARVRRMVMRQIGWMAVIGGVLGLAAALALGRAAESLLFELRGWDLQVLAIAAVVLTLVALGAGFVPARRAARVDPIQALKYE